nr:hypothetical protein [uncultured Holophaga sp.]
MPSVSRAVGHAFDHTTRILFKPFDLSKWFVMGFSAFLAKLGGGFPSSFNIPRGPGDSPAASELSQGLDWVQGHLVLVIGIALLVLLVAAVIGTVLAWLASRGDFMLLDNIVRNRAEIAEPWKAYRHPANRLFAYRIAVGVALLLFILVLLCIGLGVSWPMIREGALEQLWKPALLLLPLLLLGICFFSLYLMVLRDFGMPLMYLRGCAPGEAMRVFRRELLPGHLGTFVLFYLLKIGLGIGAGILVVMAGCLTCCIGFLPYLSSVLTLPVTVFFRCYALDLLAQIDEGWRLLPLQEPGLPE